MKKILLILGTIATTFVACSDDKSTETATSTVSDSNQISLNNLNASPASTTDTGNNDAKTVEINMDQATPAAPATTATPASGKVNPPHGEPGHDCALPVGAPLGGGAAPAAPKAQINTMPSVPAAPAGTGKVNPPHGEPGHDCAKPVGAPI